MALKGAGFFVAILKDSYFFASVALSQAYAKGARFLALR